MPTKLRRLRISEVSLCRTGANQRADVTLYKSIDEEITMFDLSKITDPSLRKMVEDEIARINALKTAEETKATEAVNKSVASDAKVVDIQKQLDTAIAKSKPTDPLAGVPEDIRKRLDDSEKALKVERDARLDRENEVIVKTLIGAAPADVVAVAKVLKRLSDEDRKTVEAVLRSAGEIAKKVETLTKETGHKQPGSDGENAGERLMKLAKTLVDTKVCKSFADAMTKASRENPSLAEEYITEQRGK